MVGVTGKKARRRGEEGIREEEGKEGGWRRGEGGLEGAKELHNGRGSVLHAGCGATATEGRVVSGTRAADAGA